MTMNSHLKTDWVALLVVLMLAVAGCTPRPPENPAPPPPSGWPTELADFTIAWTAEPGIELLTDGAAIATRAYVESYYLASITENEKYLYPGFADAVEPDQPGGPPGTSELHPKLGYSDPAIWIGTARHHVLGITRSDSDVTLTACAYLFGTAREIPNRDGYAANVGTSYDLNSGIFPMRVGLRAPSDSESKSPAQEGPRRRRTTTSSAAGRSPASCSTTCPSLRPGRRRTPTWRRASRRPTGRPKAGTSSHVCLTHCRTSRRIMRLRAGRRSPLIDVDTLSRHRERRAGLYVARQELALVEAFSA